MSETNKTPNIFSDPFRSELEEIVERAIKKALDGNGHSTMLTAEQLAEKLQVNKATVYQWVKANSVPYYQAGRFIRFNLQEVLESQRKKHLPLDKL